MPPRMPSATLRGVARRVRRIEQRIGELRVDLVGAQRDPHGHVALRRLPLDRKRHGQTIDDPVVVELENGAWFLAVEANLAAHRPGRAGNANLTPASTAVGAAIDPGASARCL